MIRELTANDASAILNIYRLGLETRNATFETRVPTWEEWNKKFHRHSRLVFTEENTIKGWAGLTPFSTREVYKGVAEVSIYVHPSFHGEGIATRLLKALIPSSEEHNTWTLFSSVFPENNATIKLHENLGFKLLGRREKIAKLEGVWRDTLIFERRSQRVGID
ncbi:GNAT family N-acetyltransferase [Gramella lutea]|uniref:GNAT family N-acetyltransferase n=1 Tax=Christiangramia lutea TaxID=1607951 RepID=A0A9X1V5W8_9FLAO|nr:GNAT family N-acetyltransferase [Christiangramia lutea]MCH4823223.1 GNAT family N-acetyltransferase [Christiangramia lutea]